MKKFVSAVLAVLMLLSLVPMSVFAANDYEINSSSSTDEYYNLISKTDWEIAPGITESQIVLNNDDGSQQQVLFVMEADTSNEYVKVVNSYTGMIPEYGNYKVGVMSEQAAIAEEMGYGNVVGAMNTCLSWYTGYSDDRVYEPLGFIMLDAEVLFDPANCGYTYGKVGFPSVLVINKDYDEDGNPRPADIPKVEMPQITSAADLDGWEDQVIPCSSGYILKNGVNQYSASHTGGAPRSVVGIKDDGTVVIMVNDGRQAPYSTGMSMYELAEVMLDLGCTWAVNCDGGGSTTWVSQRPGEELQVNNSPSDGAERETTSGILFISTAPATGEFVRANITSDSEYYTPGSSVQFDVLGTDLVGTEAEVPADVEWKIAEENMGTIDNNGFFTSNGTEGTVTVQMVYNGNVVGEHSIEIAWPDFLSFDQVNLVVPYNKSVTLGLTAKYGSREVGFDVSDVKFELSDSTIGTIDGFTFTAAAENESDSTSATITATIGTVTATATINLGKGSEIVYDFENDADISDWTFLTRYSQYGPTGPNGKVTDANGKYWYNGQNELGYLSIVDSTTGKVKNGENALKVECDFTQIYETGYHALILNMPDVDCKDAIQLGFWLYVPEGAAFSELRFGVGSSYTTEVSNGDFLLLEEGWQYITYDISGYAEDTKTWLGIDIGVDDRAGNNYNYITQANLNDKWVFYIDDMTVDYSTAVDDREEPVFGAVSLISEDGSSVALEGQKVTSNELDFQVTVADDTTLSNYVGLNEKSAKAYIDGVETECTYNNGKISVNGVTLADGVHTVKFSMADANGNVAIASAKLEVAASSGMSTVRVEPKDPDADRILIGSNYWYDVVATDIEKVQSVELALDLNNASTWELDHMELADGFEAEWSVEADENVAVITITRTASTDATGEAVLASLPVRTWESTITDYEGYEDQTPAKLVSRGIIWKKSITLEVDKGLVTFTDSTTSAFGAADMEVDTEIFFTYYSRKNVDGAVSWISEKVAAGKGWHEHTETAVADKAATCTEEGYTGRTYCEVCESVVDWGTTIEAAGHNHVVTNGVLKCDSCDNVNEFSGLYEEDGAYYYLLKGVAQTGWQMIDNQWHYFQSSTKAAVSGSYKISGVTYEFEENGKIVNGEWVNTLNGVKYSYGPAYYYSGWQTIDGNLYYFINGYRATGCQYVKSINFSVVKKWYDFGEDGICRDMPDGLYENEEGLRYIVDGVNQEGLYLIDGDYYFFAGVNCLAQKGSVYAYSTSCDLPCDTYLFGDDYKMVDGFYEKNGVTYYYENGKPGTLGLNKIDGDYYYVYYSGKCLTGSQYVSLSNCDLGNGTYEFGADGKMLNGIVEKDGATYYYENGKVGSKVGLTKIGEDYYFINYNGKCATGSFYAWATNCDLKCDTYEFAADGKMLNGIVEKDGVTYYYENGKPGTLGLNKVDGDYYYVYYYGKCLTGKQFVSLSNCELGNDTYEFDENGKMLQGIVEKEDGIYYYVNGQVGDVVGLTKIGEDYYFVNYSGKVSTGKLFAWYSNCDLKTDTYEFGADGKMLQGIVEKEDGIYYYVNGQVGDVVGLTQVGEDYYFVNYSGKVSTGKLYAWATNCDLKCDTYEFGADGKMLQGIIEKEDGIYYYVDGQLGDIVGLTQVGEDYYFVNYSGKVSTGKLYAWATNCDLKCDTYEFGTDGKMLDGFVTIGGSLYYYENGKPGTVGLNYIDGYYYFVTYSGKLIVSQTYYTWETNGLLLETNYTFNELGQIIG